ncbi:MAG TPA: NAD(P)/FAD-dependent oxidoreductase, partial [Bacteroidales bacterium]|nr:NAD(P)/FAD-dependent oxidoreductase [Bacteroidales bacterium]
TGKGRCNITNSAGLRDFLKEIHPNGRFLKKAFSQYFSSDILSLLQTMGVEVKTERGNRVFPADDNAGSVVDALVNWNKNQGVEFLYDTVVKKILIENDTIIGIRVQKGAATTDIFGSSVVIATGGKAYPATGSDGDGYRLALEAGHKVVDAVPALVPLEFQGNAHQMLSGLALKNINASVWIEGKKDSEEFGEMEFTSHGASGPAILTLSRNVVSAIRQNKKVQLSIDLKPALDNQKLDKRLIRDLNTDGKKNLSNIFKSWLPSALIPFFTESLRLNPAKEGHQVTAQERKEIRKLMKNLSFEISAYRPFKEAIITAGGVDTLEINASTMESKIVKGLYFAGEVLNLDANTGGYNLQIAWSTGWVAGNHAAKS